MTNKLPIAAVLLMFCVLPILTPIAHGQNEGPTNTASSDHDADRAWQTVSAAESIILENHISPPTRQQMFLAATRGLYRANRIPSNFELSSEFSQIVTTENFRKRFLQAWALASESTRFDESKSLKEAVNSLLQSAGTTTSRFLSADEFRVTNSIKENQYVGIGIQIGMREGTPIILDAFYGGAAHKAGAGSNDLIVEADGKPTKGRDLGEIVNDLRGPAGSKLVVKVQQVGNDEVREYEMVRTVIPIDSVEGIVRSKDGQWQLPLPRHPEIACLNFKSMVGSTSAELTQLARRIETAEIRKVILDMSSLATTDLHHAVLLADALLDEQHLGLVTSPQEKRELTTRAGSVFSEEVEIAVLTPDYVDGAMLMLLANLKNRPRTTLVGKNVVSSGLCNALYPLPNKLGAISGVPNALCYSPQFPDYTAQAGQVQLQLGRSFVNQQRFQLKTDFGATTQPERLRQLAIEVLTKGLPSQANK